VVALMVAIILTVLESGSDAGSDAGPEAVGSIAESAGAPGGGPVASGSGGGEPAASDRPLAGMVLPWLSGDGSTDVGAYLEGKPAVVNLWAYWCAPCRRELPAMAEFARQAGDSVTVLTVHSDTRPESGEELLDELGVDL